MIRTALAQRRGRRRRDRATSKRTAPARSLGDPIEVRALGEVFGRRRTPRRPAAASARSRPTSATSRRPPAMAGLHQSGAGAAAPDDPGAPAFRRSPTRTSPGTSIRSSCPTTTDAVDPAGGTPRRRGELVRLQRHQRARRARGGAGDARVASVGRGTAAASARRSRRETPDCAAAARAIRAIASSLPPTPTADADDVAPRWRRSRFTERAGVAACAAEARQKLAGSLGASRRRAAAGDRRGAGQSAAAPRRSRSCSPDRARSIRAWRASSTTRSRPSARARSLRGVARAACSAAVARR